MTAGGAGLPLLLEYLHNVNDKKNSVKYFSLLYLPSSLAFTEVSMARIFLENCLPELCRIVLLVLHCLSRENISLVLK